jgi:hypothetical protein
MNYLLEKKYKVVLIKMSVSLRRVLILWEKLLKRTVK